MQNTFEHVHYSYVDKEEIQKHMKLLSGFLILQEEFPTLKSAGDDKGKDGKKEEDGKDTQYGPGPSLRPQSRFILPNI